MEVLLSVGGLPSLHRFLAPRIAPRPGPASPPPEATGGGRGSAPNPRRSGPRLRLEEAGPHLPSPQVNTTRSFGEAWPNLKAPLRSPTMWAPRRRFRPPWGDVSEN